MPEPQSLSLYDSYLKREITLQADRAVDPGHLKMYSCGPTVYYYQHIGNVRAAWLPSMVSLVASMAKWKIEWVSNITDVGHLVGDGDESQNVTVAEDKLEKGARREGKTVSQIVDFYTADYREQLEALHIDLPVGRMNPKATEYIREQMVLALTLLKNRRAYLLDDGIYFDSAANQDLEVPFKLFFPENTSSVTYTGREIKNITKNPADFALWKFVDSASLQKWQFQDYDETWNLIQEFANQDPVETFDAYADDMEVIYGEWIPSDDAEKYESPVERVARLLITHLAEKWGCPGWHSECVAMICSILGKERLDMTSFSFSAAVQSSGRKPAVIDLHFGGEDHIDIHHKNEILQSEALGLHLSQYWVHNKFVLVDGKKMSKSLGNVYLVTGDSLQTGFESIAGQGFDPLAYRLLLHEHHFTEQLNFTWAKLAQSQNRLFNLRKEAAKIWSFFQVEVLDNSQTELLQPHLILDQKIASDDQLRRENQVLRQQWLEILTHNLDLPKFLESYQAVLTELSHQIQQLQGISYSMLRNLIQFERELVRLDLFPETIPLQVQALGAKRWEAKQAEEYHLADELRQQVATLGWQIDDYSWGWGVWLNPTLNKK